mmetsp:Transcript_11965/g.24670  ORF Transcript_11965/g.24670 Transcript_11965/m.24670 type:complete len:137 (+) Transcript_11965:1243-1653(+)
MEEPFRNTTDTQQQRNRMEANEWRGQVQFGKLVRGSRCLRRDALTCINILSVLYSWNSDKLGHLTLLLVSSRPVSSYCLIPLTTQSRSRKIIPARRFRFSLLFYVCDSLPSNDDDRAHGGNTSFVLMEAKSTYRWT